MAECGDIFRQQKASWAHLIPSTANQSAVLAEHFFNTAATLMARQLRDTVKVSLNNFVSLLAPYQVSQTSPSSWPALAGPLLYTAHSASPLHNRAATTMRESTPTFSLSLSP